MNSLLYPATIESLRDRLEKAEIERDEALARAERAEAALKPFALKNDWPLCGDIRDTDTVVCEVVRPDFTRRHVLASFGHFVADYRAAHAALPSSGDKP